MRFRVGYLQEKIPLITGKELHNKWLITVTDGQRIGEIKDVYLDAAATQVMAVLLGKEGVLSRRSVVLDRSSIQVFGIDVWLVAATGRVSHLEDLPGSDAFILMSDLRGREIQTDRGAKIGAIGEVVLDREARVLGFTLSRVYVPGPLQDKKSVVRSAIVAVGSKELPVIADLSKAETLNLPE
jgi:sporulation protein YlmC with PRC-barrel domain